MQRRFYTPMQMNRVAKTGKRLFSYEQVTKEQLKYRLPGTAILSHVREPLTVYSQRASDAGRHCRIKLYELRVRKNQVLPLSVPKSEIAFVIMLKGKLKVGIGELQSFYISDMQHCLACLPAGTTKYNFIPGTYNILYILLKRSFLISHCLTHPIAGQLLTCARHGLLQFTLIPYSLKVQELVGTVKDALSEYVQDVALSRCLFEAKMTELVVCCFREITAHQSLHVQDSTCDDQMLQRYVTYLDNHYHEPIKLADAAIRCNVHRDKVERAFKSQYGYGPGEYLSELRLAKAKHLLEFSEMTIAQIAGDCGYKNENVLTGAFMGRFNSLPSVYRAKVKG